MSIPSIAITPENPLCERVVSARALTAAMAKQLATASKGYGGVMMWEYSQASEAQLWPAIQSVL